MSDPAPSLPHVVLETDLGTITIELDVRNAPTTAGNFLRYVELGLYGSGGFYRAVKPGGDPNPIPVHALQAGLHRSEGATPLPAIPHEDTASTGLRHVAGTLSMARDDVGTADSEFFIVVEDSPALDEGGARSDDGRGFAAFGRVVDGMDVVRDIHRREQTTEGVQPQELLRRVPFRRVARKAD